MAALPETAAGPHPPTAAAPAVAGGLLDWVTALDYAARLTAAGDAIAALVRDTEPRMPVFRNRAYPLSPLPLFLREEAAARAGHHLEAYVRLLGKVAVLYRDDPEVRQWYGLPHAADVLVEAERRAGRQDGPAEIGVCRLDGYAEQDGEGLRLLENNADAPAGTLFTPRIHRTVGAVLDAAGIPLPAHAAASAPRDDALLDALGPGLADARRQGRTPVVAVLQPRGAANRESHETAGVLRALGIDAFVADPREVTAVRGRARAGGRGIDACWNKVNTVAWQQLAQDDPDLCHRWAAVLRDTDLHHVNSFLARYVCESKLTLALVQEPRFADRFTAGEHDLVAGLLPWSRKVHDGLAGRMLEDQHAYVLKEPYDIRGDGVTVGRAVGRSTWAAAVARAVAGQGVAQQYVAPAAYPVLRTDGPPRVTAMPVSLDTYVLRGRVAFHGSKASLQPRLNIFQGGRKLAVHVTADAAATGGHG
ncbi:hypothetical protein GCM10010218_53980 [Streptomyces mashuensis]|uniref:Circularly permuted type 2 ATP-grasp protein n=1 Tax=Streptomyces mashuensis TaxID=33904 RepID=A0A919B8Q6_9ACTN|nr:hypothetical protein [Streptomyces mashuensis]GHF65659.1 hypothetical protein GCM10010218_53980 [Streptomyces mashuensis]